jgi:hypothetical protein
VPRLISSSCEYTRDDDSLICLSLCQTMFWSLCGSDTYDYELLSFEHGT